MQVADFYFELPDALIARHPLAERRASRLLVLDGESGQMSHRNFADLLDYVRPGDLMVFNNTRVIPARLFGQKATGGKLEILVERVTGNRSVLAHVRSSKSPSPALRSCSTVVAQLKWSRGTTPCSSSSSTRTCCRCSSASVTCLCLLI